jgi:hypothetical protein
MVIMNKLDGVLKGFLLRFLWGFYLILGTGCFLIMNVGDKPIVR